MKLTVLYILAIILPCLPFRGHGVDRHAVVKDCLEQIACDVGDDFGENDVTQEVSWVSWTQDGFFGRMSGNVSERQLFRQAFDDVVLQFATNDWRESQRGDLIVPMDEMARILLCQMRSMSYTNAQPAVRRWVLNPSAPHRDLAVGLYCGWTPIDDDFLQVVGAVLTNAAFSAGCDRVQVFWDVSDALSRHVRRCGKDGRYADAIHLLYRTRLSSVDCAVGLDHLFVEEFPGYAFSSNRLETASAWLVDPRCPPESAARCSQITNQLLNVAKPLVWVEGLGGF